MISVKRLIAWFKKHIIGKYESPPMAKPDVVYICKGKGMPCYLHPYCVHREDPIAETDEICSHTVAPEYAKYGKCEDPENHPERFIFPESCKPSYYWEVEPNERDNLYVDSD